MSDSQPTILVFDSGVGGLSVYQEMSQLIPQYNYVYIGDNEAYPYGELEQNVLIKRVHLCINSVLAKHKVDLVVIACNTASTIVLPSLRKSLSIPVVGVVPAIKPASLISNVAVGLIATPATVTRQYTHDLISNFSSNRKVELVGSTSLVNMAEAKLRGKSIDIEDVRSELTPLLGMIDVAVLGCTHFPLIKTEISQALGNDVMMVDSGEAIARRVASLTGALDGKTNFSKNKKKHPIYMTSPTWEEHALNQTLLSMGFEAIKCRPLPHS